MKCSTLAAFVVMFSVHSVPIYSQGFASGGMQEKRFEATLNPGDIEKIVQFWIDASWNPGLFATYYSKIGFKFKDPLGNMIDKTDHWDLSKKYNGIGGKALNKHGLWELHLAPLAPLPSPVKVGFFLLYENPIINAFVVTPAGPVRLGERVPIRVLTANVNQDNKPVLGISVTAEIVFPDASEPLPFVLTDDGSEPDGVAGDGVWGCWFVPEKVGFYSIRASVEGPTPEGGRFQRDCLGNFQVKKKKAQFTGKVDVEIRKAFPEERK